MSLSGDHFLKMREEEQSNEDRYKDDEYWNNLWNGYYIGSNKDPNVLKILTNYNERINGVRSCRKKEDHKQSLKNLKK